MMEVEDWTQPPPPPLSPSNRRRSTASTSFPNRNKRHSTPVEKTSSWQGPSPSSIAITEPLLSNVTEISPRPPFADAKRSPSPAKRFLATHHPSHVTSGHVTNEPSGSRTLERFDELSLNEDHPKITDNPASAPHTSALQPASPPHNSTPSEAGGSQSLKANLSLQTPLSPAPRPPSIHSTTSSRSPSVFTPGRIPQFGTSPGNNVSSGAISKAAPTTAISSDLNSRPQVQTSTERYDTFAEHLQEENHRDSQVPGSEADLNPTPSPTESATDGMASVLNGRKRTTSTLNGVTGVGRNFTTPSTGSTWATLTSTWGAALGRRKSSLPPSSNSIIASSRPAATVSEDEDDIGVRARAARELLKRFDVGSATLPNGRNT